MYCLSLLNDFALHPDEVFILELGGGGPQGGIGLRIGQWDLLSERYRPVEFCPVFSKEGRPESCVEVTLLPPKSEELFNELVDELSASSVEITWVAGLARRVGLQGLQGIQGLLGLAASFSGLRGSGHRMSVVLGRRMR